MFVSFSIRGGKRAPGKANAIWVLASLFPPNYDHCRARDQQCNRSPLKKQNSATVFLAVDDDQHHATDRAEAAAKDYQCNLPVEVEHKKNNPRRLFGTGDFKWVG